jgi:hypothetical protein
MKTVPPVAVDIILDRFILNIFPKSLVPTALYLLAIAVGAWFLSGRIAGVLLYPSPEKEVERSKKSN